MHTLGLPLQALDRGEVDHRRSLDPRVRAARPPSDHGIERRIRFHHRVLAAEWSSAEARCWRSRLSAPTAGEKEQLSCDFLWTCSGYYRYDEGYTPDFRGLEGFDGPVVHPQHWPEGPRLQPASASS
jgi:cation diffusion facilitator CzcD-associated flavoprotein CzcO